MRRRSSTGKERKLAFESVEGMMSSDFECMLREVSDAEVTVLFGDPWWEMGFISLWVAKIANTVQQDHELF